MPDPIHNLNELMAEIEGAAIETSAGQFVRVDHIRRLMDKRKASAEADREEEAAVPPPKTWDQARRRAVDFLKEEGMPAPELGAGRSVAASDSQPPSRA